MQQGIRGLPRCRTEETPRAATPVAISLVGYVEDISKATLRRVVQRELAKLQVSGGSHLRTTLLVTGYRDCSKTRLINMTKSQLPDLECAAGRGAGQGGSRGRCITSWLIRVSPEPVELPLQSIYLPGSSTTLLS